MFSLIRVQICMQNQLVSARELARAAGLINSLALVLDKNALIHTKLFFAEVKEYMHHRYQWDRKFKLKPNTKQCLRYSLQKLSVKNLHAKLGQAEPNLVIYSDASAIAAQHTSTRTWPQEYKCVKVTPYSHKTVLSELDGSRSSEELHTERSKNHRSRFARASGTAKRKIH